MAPRVPLEDLSSSTQRVAATTSGPLAPDQAWHDMEPSCLDEHDSLLSLTGNTPGSDLIFFILPMVLATDACKSRVLWKVLATLIGRCKYRLFHPASTVPLNIQRDAALPNEEPRGFEVRQIRGIRNFGQTCFLNSVLQSLASLEPLVVYLMELLERQSHMNNGSRDETPSVFAKQLLEVLEAINGTARGRREIDPKPLLRRIGETNSQFQKLQVHEQQDAQELLQSLLQVIISDAKLDTASSSDPFFCNKTDSAPSTRTGNPFGETLTTVVAGDEQLYGANYWSPDHSTEDEEILSRHPLEASSQSIATLLERLDGMFAPNDFENLTNSQGTTLI